jgi:hypothetical protein
MVMTILPLVSDEKEHGGAPRAAFQPLHLQVRSSEPLGHQRVGPTVRLSNSLEILRPCAHSHSPRVDAIDL